MGGWKGLIGLLLLPAACLSDMWPILSHTKRDFLATIQREKRAVPIFPSYNNLNEDDLVEPYYPPSYNNQVDKVGVESGSDLYPTYTAGMWVIGGIFTLASVIAPGIVSAFTSVEPSKD